MRYWVKLGKTLRGPMEAEAVALMPGMSAHTLICPDGKNMRKRQNWGFARSFPDVRAALEEARPRAVVLVERQAPEGDPGFAPPPAPARAGVNWMVYAGAALLVVVALARC